MYHLLSYLYPLGIVKVYFEVYSFLSHYYACNTWESQIESCTCTVNRLSDKTAVE